MHMIVCGASTSGALPQTRRVQKHLYGGALMVAVLLFIQACLSVKPMYTLAGYVRATVSLRNQRVECVGHLSRSCANMPSLGVHLCCILVTYAA